MLRFLFLALLCFLSLSPPPSRAGCSLCTVPSLPASWYSWQPNGDGEWALMFAGHQVGGYRASDGIYRPLEHGEWGPASDPPVAPPVAPEPRPTTPVIENYGVEPDKIHKGQTILNGKEASPAQVRQALFGKGSVPDDAHQLSVTVIGPQDKVKAVLADLDTNQALAPYKGKIRVQGYPPDSPFVQCGFVTTGQPTIYIQDASGKVLHRQDDYAGGPAALAEAIRKADPNYKPQQDPNLHKQIPGTELLQKVPTPLLFLLGVVVLVYITKKE